MPFGSIMPALLGDDQWETESAKSPLANDGEGEAQRSESQGLGAMMRY